MKKRSIAILILFVIIVITANKSYAKYIINNTQTVAKIIIDTVPPVISLGERYTSNSERETIISKKHHVSITFFVLENNRKELNINNDYIEIVVGDEIVIPRKL